MPIDSSNQPTVATEPHLPVYDADFTDISPYGGPYGNGAYASATDMTAVLAQLAAINATLRDDRQITTDTVIVP